MKLARLRAKYRDAKHAADAHGWNYDTYKTHESGKRSISPTRAKVYAKAFRVSAGYILTGEVTGGPLDPVLARIPIRVVPLMNLVKIEELKAVAGGATPVGISDVAVNADPDITPRSFAAVVEGTAMVGSGEDSLRPGDVVVISPETPPEPGAVVLAIVGDESMLRKYRPAAHGNDVTEFFLVPNNEHFPTIRTSIADGSIIVGKAIRRITRM